MQKNVDRKIPDDIFYVNCYMFVALCSFHLYVWECRMGLIGRGIKSITQQVYLMMFIRG